MGCDLDEISSNDDVLGHVYGNGFPKCFGQFETLRFVNLIVGSHGVSRSFSNKVQ